MCVPAVLVEFQNSWTESPFIDCKMKNDYPMKSNHPLSDNDLHFPFLQFRDDSLRMVWKHDFREKAKAIDAKRDQLDQHFTYEIEQKKSKETAKALELELREERETAAVLRSQINVMKQELKDAETKRMSDLGNQLRYSEVNESVLQRSNKRLELAEKTLQDVNKKVARLVHQDRRPLNETEEMKLQKYEFSFLLEDIDVVVESYQDLLLIRRKYNELLEEKAYVLSHMGHTDRESQPQLKEAYRDFVVANEHKMQELEGRMSNFQHLVEDQKEKIEGMNKEKTNASKFQLGTSVWQAAIMNVMRNQLQDVKKENRVKDTRIKMYEIEMAKMRAKVTDLEKERELMMMKHAAISAETKNRLTVELNGDVRSPRSGSSLSSTEGMDDHNVGEERRRNVGVSQERSLKQHKEHYLPPLHNKSYPAEREGNRIYSPRKHGFNNKPLGAWSKSNEYTIALPDGLTTSPVKYGARKNYGQLPVGFGDLKNLSNQGKSKFEKSLGPTSKVRY